MILNILIKKLIKIMEKIEEFISYKKLLLFGSHGSGKTSLTKSIEKGVSEENSQSLEGKI